MFNIDDKFVHKGYSKKGQKLVTVTEDVNKKHIEIPAADMVIDYMAQVSTDTIDSRKLKGLPDNELLNNLLDAWDWETFKCKVGHALSKHGAVYVYLLNDGESGETWSIHYGLGYRVSGTYFDPNEIIISCSQYDLYKGNIYTNYFEWNQRDEYKPGALRIYKENGNVYYDAGNWYDGGFYPQDKSDHILIGSFKKIPATKIRNTSIASSDWSRISALLAEYQIMVNEIPGEWEYTKTTHQKNKLLDGHDPSSHNKDHILNGGREVDYGHANSEYGLPDSIFISGSKSVEILVATIKTYEMMINKYAFLPKDTADTGTNKHNAEVNSFNQLASQYFNTKKLQRELDWTRFFKHHVSIILPKLSLKDIKLEFEISEFESQKKDLGQAQIDALKATAKRDNAIAKSSIMQAETAEKAQTTAAKVAAKPISTQKKSEPTSK